MCSDGTTHPVLGRKAEKSVLQLSLVRVIYVFRKKDIKDKKVANLIVLLKEVIVSRCLPRKRNQQAADQVVLR